MFSLFGVPSFVSNIVSAPSHPCTVSSVGYGDLSVQGPAARAICIVYLPVAALFYGQLMALTCRTLGCAFMGDDGDDGGENTEQDTNKLEGLRAEDLAAAHAGHYSAEENGLT